MKAGNLLQLLSWYAEINALMALAYLGLRAMEKVIATLGARLPQRHWLWLARAIFLGALILPLGALLVPKDELFRPTAQIWSSGEYRNREPYALITPPRPATLIASNELRGVRVTHRSLLILFYSLLAGAAITALHYYRQRRIMKRYVQNLPVVRTLGRVRVLALEGNAIPFAARVAGRIVIAMPLSAIPHRLTRRLILLHEGHHHRQYDLVWDSVVRAIRTVTFWNPSVVLWSNYFSQLQELACDEFLVGHRKVSPQAYGRCLLQTAERALRARPILVGTTGMAASASGKLLKRRIQMILNHPTKRPPGWLTLAVGFGTFACLASAAFASRSLIQERKLSMKEAQKLAEVASRTSEIPVTVNEMVLAQLNYFIGTPEGRRQIKGGLTRMPQYQSVIDRWLAFYRAPKEIFAVPIAESAYKNTSPAGSVGGGLWGFIVQTAENYGLVVNRPLIDERLDVERATGAAIHYLSDLFDQFQDWRLALRAYNQGEGHVQALEDQYKSSDPWYLETMAPSKDKYLPKITAIIIIMKNPSVLE
jgi:membrane-bound lytic murein transglycosylase D